MASLFTKNLYYKFLNSFTCIKNAFLIENDFMLNNSLNKVLLKKFKKEKGYVININNLLGAKQYNDATANNFSSPIEESNLDFYRYFTKPFLGIKNNLNCLFLRKSKYFNKGRYSRNRQIYRTGVYLCFYVNIAVLYLL